ncbi:Txe/YoeB family addiction module toxin [Mucilaginibacter sp. BJC16-A38]|uniref:Txe/YoeB family addiction module toxin n=1 Tax=Mucilaginibacter phenanthrenivorans TaxID=1234842 RepID=UPI0021575BCA|nr:Txe/YoeB family addiction module toxin [Mucilaginibacter phenanthrenivorans]MCR8559120.1 Txe/YoeB family addiction module toxin [Mucilaginibacter phenanthrenivorans]
MKIVFLDQAWEDYLYWQNTDKATLNKVNSLLKEIERIPFEGSGKPEPLKHNFAGWWSRRINLEHRLVYKIDDNAIVILQCRYHY